MNTSTLLLALTTTALIAGCAGTSSYVRSPIDSFTYRDEPLVRQVEPGMTQQEVLRLGGQPSSVTPRATQPGLCHDYILSHEGQTQPYHVMFDGAGRVQSKGFTTCSQQERR